MLFFSETNGAAHIKNRTYPMTKYWEDDGNY